MNDFFESIWIFFIYFQHQLISKLGHLIDRHHSMPTFYFMIIFSTRYALNYFLVLFDDCLSKYICIFTMWYIYESFMPYCFIFLSFFAMRIVKPYFNNVLVTSSLNCYKFLRSSKFYLLIAPQYIISIISSGFFGI